MMVLEEANSAKDEADEVRPMKTTPNFAKKVETIEEHLEEWGRFHAEPSQQNNLL